MDNAAKGAGLRDVKALTYTVEVYQMCDTVYTIV